MPAIATTKLSVGFTTIDVEMHKAVDDDQSVEFDSVCACRKRPGSTKAKVETSTSSLVPAQPSKPAGSLVACEHCGQHYTSWAALPLRGWPKGAHGGYSVVLSKEEIEDARAGAKAHESLVVKKIVDVKAFLTAHALGTSYFLLPGKKASEVERRAYSTFLHELNQTGRCLLTRHTNRGTTKRYAILPDAGRNVLIMGTVLTQRRLPYRVEPVAFEELEALQVRQLFQLATTADVSFPPEPDPVEALVHARLPADAALEVTVAPEAP